MFKNAIEDGILLVDRCLRSSSSCILSIKNYIIVVYIFTYYVENLAVKNSGYKEATSSLDMNIRSYFVAKPSRFVRLKYSIKKITGI